MGLSLIHFAHFRVVCVNTILCICRCSAARESERSVRGTQVDLHPVPVTWRRCRWRHLVARDDAYSRWRGDDDRLLESGDGASSGRRAASEIRRRGQRRRRRRGHHDQRRAAATKSRRPVGAGRSIEITATPLTMCRSWRRLHCPERVFRHFFLLLKQVRRTRYQQHARTRSSCWTRGNAGRCNT